MELEFDKEIDAILRKARPNKGVLVGDDPPEPKEPRDQKRHVDADVIAAFVENALPDKAKQLYMEHFADCDLCRKQLAFGMQMLPNPVAEISLAPAISETKPETVPWYQSIFRTPNIAFTMGALVLAFGGILGYIILNQQEATTEAMLTPKDKVEQVRSAANVATESQAAMPTASEVPSIVDNANASAANSVAIGTSLMGSSDDAIATAKSGPNAMSAPAANAAPVSRSGQFQVDGASGSENTFIVDGQEAGNAQAAKKPAAASQPVTTDSAASGVATERDEKKATAEALKEEPKDADLAKRKMDDRAMRRDAAPPPAKSGPMQNRSNQSNAGQMSVTRTVGGKTFSNRDGAWYDTAYNGQATLNYRRGTSEYKKLDSGLRNIADTLGGTVVVVWKSKAYRIQ